MVKITRDVVDFFLEASRNLYPDEFLALLRVEKNVISEVIVVPKTTFGKGFSIMEFFHLPVTINYAGSVHSHPSPNNSPSQEDLLFFSKTGTYHLIVAFPFTDDTIAAYNNKGERIALKII